MKHRKYNMKQFIVYVKHVVVQPVAIGANSKEQALEAVKNGGGHKKGKEYIENILIDDQLIIEEKKQFTHCKDCNYAIRTDRDGLCDFCFAKRNKSNA